MRRTGRSTSPAPSRGSAPRRFPSAAEGRFHRRRCSRAACRAPCAPAPRTSTGHGGRCKETAGRVTEAQTSRLRLADEFDSVVLAMSEQVASTEMSSPASGPRAAAAAASTEVGTAQQTIASLPQSSAAITEIIAVRRRGRPDTAARPRRDHRGRPRRWGRQGLRRRRVGGRGSRRPDRSGHRAGHRAGRADPAGRRRRHRGHGHGRDDGRGDEQPGRRRSPRRWTGRGPWRPAARTSRGCRRSREKLRSEATGFLAGMRR